MPNTICPRCGYEENGTEGVVCPNCDCDDMVLKPEETEETNMKKYYAYEETNMKKYYAHELNKLAGATDLKIKIFSDRGDTKTLNLNEVSARTLIKFLEGQLAKKPEENETTFVKYFRDFYGPTGLYPMDGLKDEDILKGIKARGKDFEGDSIDRETIRDMLLHKDFSRRWDPKR